MRCPRCTLADLNDATQKCALCGYSHTGASPAPSAPAVPAEPTELDARRELAREFKIERLLEPASQPIAYLARDAEGRALTLKVVPLTHVGVPADRLLAALESAGRLDHPHIIPVLDAGTTEHFLWYATKHVEGRSLGSSIGAVAPIELPVCLRIFEQIASALEYAHRRGETHGALRPESVLVDANEWVLVGDFGTAGLVGPPEAVGPAADQRALAHLARFCLTGTAATNGSATPRNGHPALPAHVLQALRRAMSAQAADRFPSTLDFVAALGGRGGDAGETVGETVTVLRVKETPSTPPDAAPAWFSAKPRRGRPGGPMVIADSDDDPAASPWRKRLAAAAGLVLTLGAGATWLGVSSAPPTLGSYPATTAPAVTPQAIAPSVPPSPQRNLTTPSPDWASAPTRAASYPHVSPRPAAGAVRTRPAPRPPSRPTAPSWTPPPAPAPAASRAEPALLSINAIPWGTVYIDGRAIGNTPQIDVAVPPGTHRVRVERDGFRPYERSIAAASGQHLRITDIALVER
jgi:serine/threonine protein kinase